MPLTAAQARVLDKLRNPKSETSKFSRTFDLMVLPIVTFALIAAFHLHFMLLAGDWDFWVDWKDRQYWVTITPIMMMILIAVVQAIYWVHFRLPIGATTMGLLLVTGEWLNRYFGFYLWSHFPLSLVWPAAVIVSCLVLDLLLMLSRSYMVTAIVGAMAFALLFPVQNWPILAPYRLPMQHQGELLSVADYIGFTYSRTATPEYLRIIERGTLRTFGGNSTVIAAFFSGFVCMMIYFIGWHVGLFVTRLGWRNSGALKEKMGFKRDDTITKDEGLGADSSA